MAEDSSSLDSWRLQLEDFDRRFYRNLVESEREFYRDLNDLRISFGMPPVTHSCDSVVNRAYERTMKAHNETSAMAEGNRLKPLDESVKKVEVQIQQMQLLTASMNSTRNFATESNQKDEEQTQSGDVPSFQQLEKVQTSTDDEEPNQEFEFKALPESPRTSDREIVVLSESFTTTAQVPAGLGSMTAEIDESEDEPVEGTDQPYSTNNFSKPSVVLNPYEFLDSFENLGTGTHAFKVLEGMPEKDCLLFGFSAEFDHKESTGLYHTLVAQESSLVFVFDPGLLTFKGRDLNSVIEATKANLKWDPWRIMVDIKLLVFDPGGGIFSVLVGINDQGDARIYCWIVTLKMDDTLFFVFDPGITKQTSCCHFSVDFSYLELLVYGSLAIKPWWLQHRLRYVESFPLAQRRILEIAWPFGVLASVGNTTFLAFYPAGVSKEVMSLDRGELVILVYDPGGFWLF